MAKLKLNPKEIDGNERDKGTRLERFELPTLCLEGRCSIHLSYRRIMSIASGTIGEVGFEPTTSCSQSKRANQAAPLPANRRQKELGQKERPLVQELDHVSTSFEGMSI